MRWLGSGMAQVWDQLPPFSSMPGPSGMAAGMSQDGQQQVCIVNCSFLYTHRHTHITWVRMKKYCLFDWPYVCDWVGIYLNWFLLDKVNCKIGSILLPCIIIHKSKDYVTVCPQKTQSFRFRHLNVPDTNFKFNFVWYLLCYNMLIQLILLLGVVVCLKVVHVGYVWRLYNGGRYCPWYL